KRGDDARLWYLHSTGDKIYTGKTELITTFDLIYLAKIEAFRSKDVASELTPEDVKFLCESVGKQSMKTAREKYDSELYLPRQELQDTFTRFLQSNKSAFVVKGASGVGKTNFVLSVFDESIQAGSSINVWAYKGADPRLRFGDLERADYGDACES